MKKKLWEKKEFNYFVYKYKIQKVAVAELFCNNLMRLRFSQSIVAFRFPPLASMISQLYKFYYHSGNYIQTIQLSALLLFLLQIDTITEIQTMFRAWWRNVGQRKTLIAHHITYITSKCFIKSRYSFSYLDGLSDCRFLCTGWIRAQTVLKSAFPTQNLALGGVGCLGYSPYATTQFYNLMFCISLDLSFNYGQC